MYSLVREEFFCCFVVYSRFLGLFVGFDILEVELFRLVFLRLGVGKLSVYLRLWSFKIGVFRLRLFFYIL